MYAAIVYAGVLIGSLIVAVCLQYDWRPPFASVWDSLSRVVLSVGLFVLGLGATFGLTEGIILRRLSWSHRFAPATTATTLFSFLFLGILDLSPAMDPVEAMLVLGKWAGIGLVLGVLIAALPNPNVRPSADEPLAHRNARLGRLLASVVAVCGAVLVFPRQPVEPGFTAIAEYADGDDLLAFGYTSFLGSQMAVIRITSDGAKNAIILDANEWSDLGRIVTTGESAGNSKWRVVGSVRETDTADHAVLEVWAGDGLRFVLTALHDPAVSYDLPVARFAEFNAALLEVTNAVRR